MRVLFYLTCIFACSLIFWFSHISKEKTELTPQKPIEKQVNLPNQISSQKVTSPVENLRSFGNLPLENIDSKKYPHFFRESVENRGEIFRWHKAHLTYALDLNIQRRFSKSKVRRAFALWSKESKIFTFSEAPNKKQADIFIQLADPSQKNRMGEASPDKVYSVGTLRIKGNLVHEYVIKHAQVIIASNFFNYQKLREYRQEKADYGFQTLVHELGHVLGIMGHSPHEGDCMYFRAHPSGKACDQLTAEANTLAIMYGRKDALLSGSSQLSYSRTWHRSRLSNCLAFPCASRFARRDFV